MKKLISILIATVMCITLSSCVASLQAQTTDAYDDVDMNLVITYGTPFYNNDGLIMYYLYRDMYYYPYYYHNRYYFHRYHRQLPPTRMRDYRPVPRDFYKHHGNGHGNHHHHGNGHGNHHHYGNGHGNHHHYGNGGSHSNNHQRTFGNFRRNGGNVMPHNRGGGSMTGRPSMPRSSTRTTVGGGRFGGRR